ncbi:MAG: glycogen/starch synthase [Candidatus Pacebacteria bacterium]|nr:glycogen/starch synthase [Candidatus Paceibacterota bacterium]
MRQRLTIAHIISEVQPFSKSGGLATIGGSLPRAHRELGHNVLIITPYYENIVNIEGQTLEVVAENEHIELSPGIWEEVSFLKGMLPSSDVPVYFVASKKFFGERNTLYGAVNDNARFFFFDVAALHLLKLLDLKANVLHCHDWHTGLIPYFLRGRYKKDEFWHDTACLFTIHNLAFQLGHDWWAIPEGERDPGTSSLPTFDDIDRVEKINFAKRAIMNADAINTVSETYREEIMTKDFGQELNRVLKNREKIVFGIVNGIDYDDYNPLTDPGLVQHYSDKSANRKKDNKLYIQKKYGLEVDESVPLICMTSRITNQKGFDLFSLVVSTILRLNAQIIIMGDGDKALSDTLSAAEKEFPKKFAFVPFDSDMETSLYAGSDMFLLPSRFEPCGINQLIALRYGCIPIVHHIGGLADTITDFDPYEQTGNGFTFTRYDSGNLLIAIVRALETYKYKDTWKALVVFGLQQANSWIIPAQKYIELYKTTIRLKKKFMRNGGGNGK